jgi:DMSO/TMAO reductase YedYZ molybdopterin-dependent catalytic subunit
LTLGQAGAFSEWRLDVDGLVAHPGRVSISDLKSLPSRSQITQVTCEEGWRYIAEWIGTPLSYVLEAAGILPQAKFVVYYSIEKDWWIALTWLMRCILDVSDIWLQRR